MLHFGSVRPINCFSLFPGFFIWSSVRGIFSLISGFLDWSSARGRFERLDDGPNGPLGFNFGVIFDVGVIGLEGFFAQGTVVCFGTFSL